MMTNHKSIEAMEQRANEQRARLQHSVEELGSSLRERLDVEKLAREHVWSLSAGVAVVALALGYGVAALFTD